MPSISVYSYYSHFVEGGLIEHELDKLKAENYLYS